MESKKRNVGSFVPTLSPMSETRVTSVEESSVHAPFRSEPTTETATSMTDSAPRQAATSGRRQTNEPTHAKRSFVSEDIHSQDVKIPSASSPGPQRGLLLHRPQPSALPAQHYQQPHARTGDEELFETQTCLRNYSVQFNFFLADFTQVENCDHVLTSPCSKWVVKRLQGRRGEKDVSYTFLMVQYFKALSERNRPTTNNHYYIMENFGPI